VGALLPRIAAAVAYTFSTPIAGDSVPVTLVLSDAPSSAGVDVSISIPAGQGDLLGLFGNVSNEALVPGMGISDTSHIVTQSSFSANGVTKVGGGNTMEPIGNWDWGLRFGQNGSAGGPVLGASFRITGSGITVAQLTGAVNQGWRFGVRVQSTLGPGGSAKVGLSGSQPPNGQGPTVSISSPVNGFLTRNTPITVTGSFTGMPPVTVTVNGAAATLSGSSYTASVPLVEGPNTLTATATNSGGSASASVTVVRDSTAPVITFTSPPEGLVTAETSVLLTGTVTDASPITSFTLNGQTVALTNGAFSTTVSLAVGANPLTASATDAAGNTGSASITVSRALVPTIAISSPANGLLTRNTPLTVTGTFTGTAPIAIAVNGATATLSGTSYSASVALSEGANALMATATNAVGSASASGSVTLDTTPPVVTITSPPDGTLTGTPTITVTGTVTDASPISAFAVNGNAVTLSAGAFTATVALLSGPNPIVAQATDAAGNTGSAAITVNRGAAPSIAISSPANGLLTRDTPITVSGTFAGTAPVTVKVNGVTATLSGSSYSASVPVVEGGNTLTATATNALGSASASVSATLDTTPPVVTITGPADGALVAGTPVTVTGTVTDASPISAFTVNDTPVTLSSGAFTTTVSVAVGSNPISASATDAAGNTGTAAISVTRATPPTISIAAPANGLLTRNTPISVTGTVSGTPPLSVNVNGVGATISGASFSATVPLNEGVNTLAAIATNAAGSANASVTATLDTTPPVVTITTPANGAVFTTTPQTVAGTVTDASPIAALTIGGQPAPPGNAFSRSYDLVSGSNPIAVQATDAAGNVGISAVIVTLQAAQTPLSIRIQSPPDGSVVSTPYLPVSGSVSDPNASVSVNGIGADTTADHAFVAPLVVLQEGDNTLVATAQRTGSTATDTVTVRYQKPPQIHILHPRNGTRLRVTTTDVSGFVDDVSAAVDVNGVTASVDEAGGFIAHGVPLSVGPNPLNAQAVSLDGLVGTDSAIVTRDDDQPPLLRVVLYDREASTIADGFAAFKDSLARRGVSTEQFTPVVDQVLSGKSSSVQLFVFGEQPGSVTIPEVAEFGAQPTQELRPIEELEQEIDPVLFVQILPADFEPSYFQVYSLRIREVGE
jgi:hypothetical protein